MNGPAPTAVYLYAGDQIVENVTTGNLYFQDSLGNTSHVTDAAGNLFESYTYSAFGVPTFYDADGHLRIVSYDPAGNPITASGLGIRHLFQGQLWTQETGLNDYRNRVELPAMDVFLQPDPIGFKGDGANIYRFCGNDAVNRTDPMGLFPVNQIDFNPGLQGPGRDLAQRLAMSNLEDAMNKLLDLFKPSQKSSQTPPGTDGPSQNARDYRGARATVEHDENFDVTKDPII
jgi:RHS repeat-associated protein